MGTSNRRNSSAAFNVSRITSSSGISTKKKAVRRLSVRMLEDMLIRCRIYWSSIQDAVLLGLLAADAGDHLFILPHFLPQLRDLGDPLIVDLGHAEVIQSMPQGDQVVNVVVVAALHHNVHHGVEDGALLHRRLGGGRLDVVLDLRGAPDPGHTCPGSCAGSPPDTP
jgi:hypothetical protein